MSLKTSDCEFCDVFTMMRVKMLLLGVALAFGYYIGRGIILVLALLLP